ncbi:3D domain-containing protein [Clostridium perfringens]|uniref:3D domain-containing protein n=1 Tax=Clostridium perfringens TaxID=1502 RepID=UPI001A229712|nr:3D domain-containing protein [Clostridium perfringens]MDG6876171.1 Cell wall-binding protein YocH precursor [Clostridium perfringens]MDG6886385.1 Cell wall-binding protein YocH precursor [Clostridium perfringens]MDH5077845.1 Cell wall-binding protein YocH precursor [Clostridium perfringens]MDK0720597.1 3D domain-containing protein [Clostridium perfringens]MDM0448823.1 3D domain-containing protein [Clostridium perfringens]
MQKRFLSALIAMSISISATHVVFADTVNDKKSTIQENKVKYSQLDNEVISLNSQVSKLNNEIEDLNAKLEDNKAKMKDTEENLKETESKVSTLKTEINEKQSVLGKRMRAMYKSKDSMNPVVFLLKSEDLSDLITRIDALARVTALDKNLIQSLAEQKDSLNSDIKKLERDKAELKELKASNEESLKTLDNKKIEEQKKIDELNKQKEAVLEVIKENEMSLISHSVSIINSSSSINELESAVSTLNQLIPQLNIDSVKEAANNSLQAAKNKIESLKAEEAKKAEEAAKNNAANSSNPTSSNNSYSQPSSDGKYKKTLSMEATAYSGGTLTAMGLKPVRDPGGISTIAVDPSVIPLGSKVYIPGYGYAIASDTGGVIKGNIIDLYMNSHDECTSWGRRQVTLHIVAYPGEW